METKIGLGDLADAVRALVEADDAEFRVQTETTSPWVEFIFTWWGIGYLTLTLQAGFLVDNSEQKTAELIAGMVNAQRRKREMGTEG